MDKSASGPTNKQLPDDYDYKAAFSKRLKEAIYHSCGGTDNREFFETNIINTLNDLGSPKQRDVFRRWYAGTNMPDMLAFSLIVQELITIGRSGYDAEYLLLGDDAPARAANQTVVLARKIDDISKDVHDIKEHIVTHELGLEGVVMRHTVRLLRDLKQNQPTDSTAMQSEAERISVSKSDEPFIAGFIPDDLMEIIASHAKHTRIATFRLDDGVAKTPQTVRTRPWRFLRIVADNLNRGRTYDYILSGKPKALKASVKKYYSEITNRSVENAPNLLKGMTFKSTDLPLGASFLLMDIDPDKFYSTHHAFYKELRTDYILESKVGKATRLTIGAVMSHSPKTHGSLLMDKDRTEQAVAAWKAYAKTAQTIDTTS